MALDFITAIGNALSEVAKDVKPYIDDHFAQKYEKENQERMREYDNIMSMSGDKRADALDLFVRDLFTKAGTNGGPISSETIAVPVHHFNQLVSELSEGIKKDALLASLQFKDK